MGLIFHFSCARRRMRLVLMILSSPNPRLPPLTTLNAPSIQSSSLLRVGLDMVAELLETVRR
jgi:hypothetical protein